MWRIVLFACLAVSACVAVRDPRLDFHSGGDRAERTDLPNKSMEGPSSELHFHASPDSEHRHRFEELFRQSNASSGRALPDSVDWRKHGVVTPVKNQGATGSDVAFAFLDVLESHRAVKTGELEYASMAELLACCGNDVHFLTALYGCVHKLHGLCSNSTYKPVEGKCNSASCKAIFIFGKVNVVPQGNEQALAEAVALEPVLVGVDAEDQAFMEYRDGVFRDPDCKGTQLDHAMLLVGYGQTDKGEKYWILKNSWGVDWGMEGYMLMARDAGNMCGVASFATYPE